jgi:metal-responsive CopG/Arc/MetJ family transcriptional regulator
MQHFAKVAISIPRATLRSLERARKRLRRTRSAVVTMALDRWLREQALGSEDERYVRGYLARPEHTDDLAAIAAAATAEWERWT